MNVLVTGGAGYIGSHICVELANNGFAVTIVDNLCNSYAAVPHRIEEITGRPIKFIQGDVRDDQVLDHALSDIDAVIHCAGLKAVGESVLMPLAYYDNNVIGSLKLLAAMKRRNIKNIVFSSSATVYGDGSNPPFKETAPLAPTNPYGSSKWMIERILLDLAAAELQQCVVAILRYFNPVGAHASGLIGENPRGVPNNLMPVVMSVASQKQSHMLIYGDDYPTADGTAVRDYIHVVDLARGHLRALNAIKTMQGGSFIVNLGTGRGHSVKEVVSAFKKASGREIPTVIHARRPGDTAVSLADPSLAEKLLGWKASLDLADMCADTWRWARNSGATPFDASTR